MKIRMFISIPLKNPDVLKGVLEDVGSLQNVRPSPLSQMHITLRFIGDIDDGKTKKVVRCVEDAVRDTVAFPITIKGQGASRIRRGPLSSGSVPIRRTTSAS